MPRRKGTPNNSAWHRALKEWNRQENKGKWCIPKKGSANYLQVKRIQRRLEGKPVRRYAKRRKKTTTRRRRKK